MIASVIIPTYNRQALTERAIKSVFDCTGSDQVQIVIVDDYSTEPFSSKLLRSHDIIIRNNKNQGASKSRQIGIEAAEGDIIYLLDSDDYFLCRDFVLDHSIVKGTKGLYYCDRIKNSKKIINYPDYISKDRYFDQIYWGKPPTCSFCFDSKIDVKFDEKLIDHEDWDFLYSFLEKGYPVKKIKGLVGIDKNDRKSLSRAKDYKKVLPWLDKIKSTQNLEIYDFAKFWDLSKYSMCMSLSEFITKSIYYLSKGKVSLVFIAKRFIQRFL